MPELPVPVISGTYGPPRQRFVRWLGHEVVIEKTTHNQHRDRWVAYPRGGERAKARPFAHFGEAEMWALHWLWRAGGSPELPGLKLDR